MSSRSPLLLLSGAPGVAGSIASHLAADGQRVRLIAVGEPDPEVVSLIRETETSLLLFVDGQCIACSDETARFAERVCAETELAVSPNSAPATLEVIALLVNAGSLAFDAED